MLPKLAAPIEPTIPPIKPGVYVEERETVPAHMIVSVRPVVVNAGEVTEVAEVTALPTVVLTVPKVPVTTNTIIDW